MIGGKKGETAASGSGSTSSSGEIKAILGKEEVSLKEN